MGTMWTEEDTATGPAQFKHGQLVWAKCGQHPHWPARISSAITKQSVEVEFFPDETAGFAEVHPSQVVSWMLGYEEYSKPRGNDHKFRQAIEAATVVWATDATVHP